PDEFWWAITGTTPMAGMPSPWRFDWDAAASLEFADVVCLTADSVPYDAAPLRSHGIRLRDLANGSDPPDADAELEKVRKAVGFVMDAHAAGRGAIVHCAGGRGRTGTVVGGALVKLGTPAVDVVRWLDTVHRAR